MLGFVGTFGGFGTICCTLASGQVELGLAVAGKCGYSLFNDEHSRNRVHPMGQMLELAVSGSISMGQ